MRSSWTPWILTVALLLTASTADARRRRKRRPPPPPQTEAPAATETKAPVTEVQAAPAATTPKTPSSPVGMPRLVSNRLRVAVGALDAPDLAESERLTLEEAISLEIQRASEQEVVSTSDMRAYLNLAQQQQLLGCDEGECMGELSDALAVQQLVAGSVRKVGEGWIVSLQRADLVNHRVLERSSQEAEAVGQPLLLAVRRAVPPLFGVVGRIVVWDQPEQAELYVDDRWVGVTPVDAVPVKQPGEHRVAINGPGLTSWDAVINVEAGADARVRALNRSIVLLEEEAAATRRNGWLLLAGGVAAAALAATSWTLAVRNDRRLDKVDLRTLSQSEIDGITSTTVNLTAIASILSTATLVLTGAGGWTLATNDAQGLLDAEIP